MSPLATTRWDRRIIGLVFSLIRLGEGVAKALFALAVGVAGGVVKECDAQIVGVADDLRCLVDGQRCHAHAALYDGGGILEPVDGFHDEIPA